MTYELTLGIEHVMTGVELVPQGQQRLRFEYAGPSTMRVTSSLPFHAVWPNNGAGSPPVTLNARQADNDLTMSFSREEIEWFAQRMAQAMSNLR
jgi:hypothetical protein